MMVKIMSYDRSNSWSMWTDVVHVSMSCINKYEYNVLDNVVTYPEVDMGKYADYFLFDKADELQRFNCDCINNKNEVDCPRCGREGTGYKFNYRYIYCDMKDGSGKTIVTDTMVYFLNDEGKTIDKVVVNPPIN